VERRLGLGGTGITYHAIEHGAIDLYVEYTGTLSRVIVKDPSLRTTEAIRQRLAAEGLTISDPLGFDNTYALAVLETRAARLGLRTIGDLARHAELTAAFSSGFLEREDGWPGLRRRYGLRLRDVRVVEHALAYRALVSGDVEVIDVFSTDGQLERLRLRLLEDDQRFFPDYSAVLLARRTFVERFPRSWRALEESLVGRIDDRQMARLNALADLDRKGIPEVAAGFLGTERAGTCGCGQPDRYEEHPPRLKEPDDSFFETMRGNQFWQYRQGLCTGPGGRTDAESRHSKRFAPRRT